MEDVWSEKEMDVFKHNRFTLITYRPQVSYSSLTDDFLTIILPKIKQKCNFFFMGDREG